MYLLLEFVSEQIKILPALENRKGPVTFKDAWNPRVDDSVKLEPGEMELCTYYVLCIVSRFILLH